MTSCFLDTGYLIALEASDDQHHDAALRHWREEILVAPPLIITTSYVFDEVVTFFNSRDRHAKAIEIGRRLQASDTVEIVHVTRELFNAGWLLFQERSDKRYSLTDCISFVVMERRQIENAMAFDRHFEQAGFQLLP